MGGDFNYPADPGDAENAASPYGDRPWDGNGNIGLRPVCRRAGLPGPRLMVSTGDAKGRPPVWTFSRNRRTAARAEAEPAHEPVLTMAELDGGTFPFKADDHTNRIEVTVSPFRIGKHEVTYAVWKRVLQWAEANGYEFSLTGDMGSMYWYCFIHSPEEPVTHLHWHDLLVWCNALSEMEGRTPCYYTDPERTKVYRKAFTYRPIKVSGPQMAAAGQKWYSDYDPNAIYNQPWLFCRWDADGYRLPTLAEFHYAASGGTGNLHFWAGEAPAGQYRWGPLNSGGRSHRVGAREPNPFGLYDVMGNVQEWLWSTEPGRVKTRPYELDKNNPKHSPFWAWDYEKAFAPICNPCYAGGSFLSGRWDSAPMTTYYPDFGFRVVRCTAGTHPRDGKEPLAEWPKAIDIDPNDYDLLQATDGPGGPGTVWRGNLHRTGSYDSRGVAELDGVKWRFDTGGPVRSSPVVFDGAVYVGSSGGHFHALDAEAGREKWRVPVEGGVVSSACVVDGVVYFGANDRRLYAVDAADGSVLWRAQGSGPISTSPAVAHGLVFMEGPVGFDAANGEEVWRQKGVRFRGYGDERLSSVALLPRLLIQNGDVCLIEEARFIVGNGGAWSAHNVDAVAEGLILEATSNVGGGIGAGGASLIARDLETGQQRWQKVTSLSGDVATVREVLLCSPAVWERKAYIGSDHGEMYCLDLDSGEELWSFQAGGAIRSAPSVSARDGVLYFGCDDGHLYALDARTGKPGWQFRTGGKIGCSPCPADGAVYVGSDDGNVYALH